MTIVRDSPLRLLFIARSSRPSIRLPQILSANSESRPLTGRRPDVPGPTIYRLDSLASLAREVDDLSRRLEQSGRTLRGRFLSPWKRCHLHGIMVPSIVQVFVRSYEPVREFLSGLALITANATTRQPNDTEPRVIKGSCIQMTLLLREIYDFLKIAL